MVPGLAPCSTAAEPLLPCAVRAGHASLTPIPNSYVEGPRLQTRGISKAEDTLLPGVTSWYEPQYFPRHSCSLLPPLSQVERKISMALTSSTSPFWKSWLLHSSQGNQSSSRCKWPTVTISAPQVPAETPAANPAPFSFCVRANCIYSPNKAPSLSSCPDTSPGIAQQ